MSNKKKKREQKAPEQTPGEQSNDVIMLPKPVITTESPSEPQKQGRGIVLIALGNSQYGCMAANLAATIRFMDKEINIHLVHTEESIMRLNDGHKALFTSMAVCPAEYYTKNEKIVYLKAKTCIWELSPFEETILMDVDLAWLSDREGNKAPSKIFEALKDVEFTMQNRGFADLSKEPLNEKYCLWCNIKEVKEAYQTDGRFYMLASEFIYFNRSEANRKYFEFVREVFDKPKIKGALFGGDLPDEFAFDIASAVLKHYPHKDNYVNIYWHQIEPRMGMNSIVTSYYGYSIGGNSAPEDVRMNYNAITKFCCNHFKVLHFPYSPKHKWLPERRTR
jgi:hypothetical protein